jgi:hypothetical protein
MVKVMSCPFGHNWQSSEAGGASAVLALCPHCSPLAQCATLPFDGPRVPAFLSASTSPWPVIPDYQILGVLGQGGMGVVHKARQVSLNRLVALKMLWPNPSAGPEELRRFLGEAEVAAALQHPNIVAVHAVDRDPARPFFTCELVEGGTLAQRIAGKPQPPRQAAQVVRALALALHFAHEKGIVHRDLKPANVLLTADGTPKIGDFGLARRLESPNGLTRTGAIMGTPSYMAPEQASGVCRQVSPAIDVYALGAVLYEMLTGRPPFQGETATDTVMQVLTSEPVPPSRLCSRVPRDLETICLKCLEKEPARRYASARALAEDCASFLRGEPILARPVGPVGRLDRWRRRNPVAAWLCAALVLAAVVGFAAVTWKWREAAAQSARAKTALDMVSDQAVREEAARRKAEDAKQVADEAQKLATRKAEAEGRARRKLESTLYCRDVVLASSLLGSNLPDAERLLDGWPRLRHWEWGYLRRLCRRDVLVLNEHTEYINQVAYHPGGKLAASASADGTVRVWDLDAGREKLTLRGGAAAYVAVAFSPDGTLLAAGAGTIKKPAQGGEVKVWEVASGREKLTLRGHTAMVNGVAFRPDGKRLATCSGNPQKLPEPGEVKVWDVQTGKEVVTLEGSTGNHTRVAYSPDGKLLAADGFARPRPCGTPTPGGRR